MNKNIISKFYVAVAMLGWDCREVWVMNEVPHICVGGGLVSVFRDY
jgi:hypothetical protein